MNASSDSRPTPNSPESGQTFAPVNDRLATDRPSAINVAPASDGSSSSAVPQLGSLGTVAQTKMAQPAAMTIANPHPQKSQRRLPKILAITAGVAAAAGLGAGLALRYAISTGSVPAVLQTDQTFPPQPGWLQPESPVATPVPIIPVPPVYEAPVPTAPERQTVPPPSAPSSTPVPLPTLPSPDVYPSSNPLSPASPEPVTAPTPAPIAPPDASQPLQPDSQPPVTSSPDLAPSPSPTP